VLPGYNYRTHLCILRKADVALWHSDNGIMLNNWDILCAISYVGMVLLRGNHQYIDLLDIEWNSKQDRGINTRTSTLTIELLSLCLQRVDSNRRPNSTPPIIL
jgi:hypothetical protein